MSKNINTTLLVLSVSLLCSVSAMHRSIQKDNVYFLASFQIFQSVYNCTLYMKYSSVVSRILYDDLDLQNIVWYMCRLSSYAAGVCQLVFYLIWHAMYKTQEYKIFQRIGILYQNLYGYRLYKYSKIFLLTYV